MKSHPALFLATIFGMSGLCSVLGAILGCLEFIAVTRSTTDTLPLMSSALLGVILGYFMGGMVGAALAFRGRTTPASPERARFKQFIALMVLAYIVIESGLFFLLGEVFFYLLWASPILTVLLFVIKSALIPTAIAALMMWQARQPRRVAMP